MENEKQPNIYLGNFKTKTRKTGEEFLVGDICLETMDQIPESFIKAGNNGKHYVKVIILKNINPDKYGNSHVLKVDTFVPDPNYKKAQQESY